MKAIITLVLATLSMQSFALGLELGFFKCTSDETQQLNGMYHQIKLDFGMKHLGQNTLVVPYGRGATIKTEAAQISGTYDVKIAWEIAELSSNNPDVLYVKERKSSRNISNDSFYQGRKYKDFARFSLPMDTMGKWELILPNALVNGTETKTDKAVIMLTYIEDHHGGTVPLTCEKYAEPL